MGPLGALARVSPVVSAASRRQFLGFPVGRGKVGFTHAQSTCSGRGWLVVRVCRRPRCRTDRPRLWRHYGHRHRQTRCRAALLAQRHRRQMAFSQVRAAVRCRRALREAQRVQHERHRVSHHALGAPMGRGAAAGALHRRRRAREGVSGADEPVHRCGQAGGGEAAAQALGQHGRARLVQWRRP